jgi:hypothetical protein
MQQALKPAPGAARAQIIASELFDEFDAAMGEAATASHMSFRRERLPPLTCDVESRGGRRNPDACAWHASNKNRGQAGRAGRVALRGGGNKASPSALSAFVPPGKLPASTPQHFPSALP